MKKEKITTGKSELKINPNIKPLGDKVLIKELEGSDRAEKTAGGIFIPDTVKEDRGSKRGTVVAVGPGRMEEGKLVSMTVKVGDKVLYQWGDTVKIGETEYTIVSESSLLAVIK
ncbi:MAG: co-chaperone GroES [bacterium]|nr:co-chaperone GroES [bacterium]